MESATITKVTLRQEKLRSGKVSLYLDYYPPIWNPRIKKMSRREFLGGSGVIPWQSYPKMIDKRYMKNGRSDTPCS